MLPMKGKMNRRNRRKLCRSWGGKRICCLPKLLTLSILFYTVWLQWSPTASNWPSGGQNLDGSSQARRWDSSIVCLVGVSRILPNFDDFDQKFIPSHSEHKFLNEHTLHFGKDIIFLSEYTKNFQKPLWKYRPRSNPECDAYWSGCKPRPVDSPLVEPFQSGF